MTLLKLLLVTCLTLNIASAFTTKNKNESCDFTSFNATLQDEVIVLRTYKLEFNIAKSWIVRRIMINIYFEVRKPISHIGLYTNNQVIHKDMVFLTYKQVKSDSTKLVESKPVRHCIKKNIHIIEFPTLSNGTNYTLLIECHNNIPSNFGIENIRKDQLGDSFLYRILDSWSGFGIIFLISTYSQYPTKIIFDIDKSPDTQLFVNTLNITFDTYSYTKRVAKFSLSMPIHQTMILLGRNFEKTQKSQIIFWHSPKMRNEIQHAISVSRQLWLQMGLYFQILLEDNQWFREPYSVVSPYDKYPTVSSLGLIVYRQSDITYNASENDFARKVAVEMTVSYEMSRQTLSHTVIPSSWETKCLQESLAVYLHYNMLDKIRVYSEVDSEDSLISYLYVVQILQPSLYNDAVFRLKPITHGISTTDEIDKSFSSRLYYNKGSAFWSILESIVSKVVIRNVINKYISRYAFTRANVENFWDIMREVIIITQTDLYDVITYKGIMHSWFSQSHYPEIHVGTNYTYNSLTVHLRQYPAQDRNCRNTNCNCTNCIWPMFTVVSLHRHDEIYDMSRFLLFSRNHIFNSSDIRGGYDFVILNLGQAGYYRVNYDDTNWLRIVQFLNYRNYKKIHVLNRAKLIDDSYHFLTNGQMEWSMFLQLIKYLKRETSYIAWYPMINIMFYMTHFFSHPASEDVKPTLTEIFGSLLENIGYTENADDDDMTKSLRLLGSWWACKLGYSVCRETATQSLSLYLLNPSKYLIKPWWEKWVFCAGMMDGNNTIFSALMNEYLRLQDARLFKFMACNEKADNFINILNFLKVSEVFKSKIKTIKLEYNYVTHFIKQHATNLTLMRFVISNAEDLIPGVLSNTQFWADIILNTHTKEELFTLKEVVMSCVPEVSTMYVSVNGLFKRQLQRINKLFSTNYYI